MFGNIIPRLRCGLGQLSLSPRPWKRVRSKFKQVKKLGQGSFGTAYSAKLAGKPVIVKVADPFPGAVSPAESLDAMAKEVKVLRRLQKFPFVPRLVEIGPDYFVQEDVGGESMLSLLSKEGLEAREILAEVVAAGVILSKIHQEGIAHNDFAPRNILLTPGGVVVIDYGMAIERDVDGVDAFREALAKDLLALLDDAVTAMEARDVSPAVRASVLSNVAKFRSGIVDRDFDEGTANAISRALVFALAQTVAVARRGKPVKHEKIQWQVADLFQDGLMDDAALKDLLPGGRADDLPDTAFHRKQLKKGIAHEMEHTNDPRIAAEIAKDHLVTDGMYYEKLEKMEASMLGVDAFTRSLMKLDIKGKL